MSSQTGMTANDAVVSVIRSKMRGASPAVTNAELADRVHVAENTIQSYLTDTRPMKGKRGGRVEMKVNAVDAIADAFGLKGSELMAEAETIRAKGAPSLSVTPQQAEPTTRSDESPPPDVTRVVRNRRQKSRTRTKMDEVLNLADGIGKDSSNRGHQTGESDIT